MSEVASTSLLDELLAGNERPQTYARIRAEAETFLNTTGIPSKRHERWKYTNVKRLFDNGLKVAAPAACSISSGSEFDNGHVKTGFLQETGEFVGSSSIHRTEELAALNTALFNDVFTVRIKKGTQLDRPIILDQTLALQERELANTRLLIIVEEGASVNILHHFHGTDNPDSVLLNHVTEVFVARNARLELNILQEVPDANVMNTTEAACQRDARFIINTCQLAGKLLRNDVNVRLKEEHVEAHLNGFYMLNGTDLFDNHTLVDHLVPDCESREVYRGILGGRSTGVFNGKVFVHPDAQKTNGYQQNNNILLSDEAVMNSKPELEIYADDVRCSHGSTTGQLDPDAIFYLRTRGLDEFGALQLLLGGFAAEVFDHVSNGGLREMLEQKVQAKLKEMNA